MRAQPSDLLALDARGLRARLGTTEVLHGIDLALPASALSSVDLPAPLGPTTLVQRPACCRTRAKWRCWASRWRA
jgi:hypothetical protein